MLYEVITKLAHPEADVACITGEASILMCIQELSTAKQYRLPIKVVNLNNRYMGMVRQWQEFFHGNRYSESYMDALPRITSYNVCYTKLLRPRTASRNAVSPHSPRGPRPTSSTRSAALRARARHQREGARARQRRDCRELEQPGHLSYNFV